MNRRFALPLAITLSAHAILLLGSTRPTPHTKPKPKELDTVWLTPPPPKDLETEASAETAAANGKKDVEAPPSLPPLAPVVDVRTPFVMTEPPLIHSDRPTTMSIVPQGPPGTNEGNGSGLKGQVLVNIDALDNPPKTRFQASPQYPYTLKAAGISGNVSVEFTVDESGRVLNPHVLSSTHPEFEGPTLKAVQSWRFEPGKRLGRPVRFRMSVPVQFSLNDRD